MPTSGPQAGEHQEEKKHEQLIHIHVKLAAPASLSGVHLAGQGLKEDTRGRWVGPARRGKMGRSQSEGVCPREGVSDHLGV